MDSLSSGALSSLHRRDRSIGIHPASVHSIGLQVICCIVMHRTRCMRAGLLSATCSIVVPPARCGSFDVMQQLGCMHANQCTVMQLLGCMHAVQLHACYSAACMLLGCMHMNRCAVMRVSLWERFGIVRQTRGVDILSELVVRVCPEGSYGIVLKESLSFARATWLVEWDPVGGCA